MTTGPATPWIVTTATAVMGWTAHANWPRIAQGWNWWKLSGGVKGIWKAFWEGVE